MADYFINQYGLVERAWNDLSYMYGNWRQLSAFDRSLRNGFRCILCCDRKTLPEDAFDPIEIEEVRDYAEEIAVSDDIFAIYKQQFMYDELPLNASPEFRNDTFPYWWFFISVNIY